LKKLILAIVLTGVLLVAGCTVVAPPSNVVPGGKLPAPVSTSNTQITYEGSQTVPSLVEGFGVNGGMRVDPEYPIYPGYSGIVPLTITNGNDRDRVFGISVISPTSLKQGYEALPPEYFCWIVISQPTVAIQKGCAYQVPITIKMPSDADYRGKNVEVWIHVADTTQTGNVLIGYDSEWFITTAD
jgi:hypothetical protein